eukprot:GHRQ01002014.1.p1 GENE.GHRQ01002014.1~~GHRQ01002014.1.p1  ORF type:complete len:500 (+),score=147.81 GHRQ01002014.1:1190-2689(+)
MGHARAPSVALFDIELDDASLVHEKVAAAAQQLRSLLNSTSETRKQLLRDAEQALEVALHGESVDLHAFAEVLANRGHLVCLRTGRPSNVAQVALRHTFVVAGVTGSSTEEEASSSSSPDSSSCLSPTAAQLFVIDPSFKDAFLLSNASPAYQCLWEQLPRLFVGTADQLVTVVELMCSQMQLVFAETAASCPPWRTAASMISKWLPSSADDVPVLPGSSSSSLDPSASAAAAGIADQSAQGLGGMGSYFQLSSSSAFNCQPFDGARAANRSGQFACVGHTSGSNVLLGSSLGSGSPLGVLAAATDAIKPAFGGDAYTEHNFSAFGGISCVVYSGVAPESCAGKQAVFVDASTCWENDASDGAEPGGVAIRSNSSMSSRGGQDYFRSGPAALCQQQLPVPLPVARRSSTTGSGSSHVRGLSPLDISRFNNSSSYCNTEGSFDLFPLARCISDQQKQQGRADALRRELQSSRSATTKRRPGLLSQTSALSAAIASQSLPR